MFIVRHGRSSSASHQSNQQQHRVGDGDNVADDDDAADDDDDDDDDDGDERDHKDNEEMRVLFQYPLPQQPQLQEQEKDLGGGGGGGGGGGAGAREARVLVQKVRTVIMGPGEWIDVAMDAFPPGASCDRVQQCNYEFHVFLHACNAVKDWV